MASNTPWPPPASVALLLGHKDRLPSRMSLKLCFSVVRSLRACKGPKHSLAVLWVDCMSTRHFQKFQVQAAIPHFGAARAK